MPAKLSQMDAFPTSIMKSCTDVFSPLIARLVALSFSDDVFLKRYKTASMSPLLKKKGLDGDNLANCRPISNLHTVSKDCSGRESYRTSSWHHALTSCSQRALHRDRSVDTDQRHLHSSRQQINNAAHPNRPLGGVRHDRQQHILTRLERSFGLSGTVLSWIRSYIEGQQQFTCLGKF
jgi:hypothetical protein